MGKLKNEGHGIKTSLSRGKLEARAQPKAPLARAVDPNGKPPLSAGKPSKGYVDFRNALGAEVAAILPDSTPQVVPALVHHVKVDDAGVAYLMDDELVKIDLLSVLQAHKMLVATGHAREFELALSKLVGVDDYKVQIHPHIANLIADHISASELAETAQTMSVAWKSPYGFIASAAGSVTVKPTKPPDWIIPDPKQ